MNCKPGDLAVIVDALPAGRFLLGRIVEVLRRAEDDSELGATWWVRFPRAITNPISGEAGDEGAAADVFLRPIRDPGDDAVDWISRRTPRSADLREDELTRARGDLQEQAS